MYDSPQEMIHRGPEAIHPIRHDPELEAIQQRTMHALDIRAPKVILTTLPYGGDLEMDLAGAVMGKIRAKRNMLL